MLSFVHAQKRGFFRLNALPQDFEEALYRPRDDAAKSNPALAMLMALGLSSANLRDMMSNPSKSVEPLKKLIANGTLYINGSTQDALLQLLNKLHAIIMNVPSSTIRTCCVRVLNPESLARDSDSFIFNKLRQEITEDSREDSTAIARMLVLRKIGEMKNLQRQYPSNILSEAIERYTEIAHNFENHSFEDLYSYKDDILNTIRQYIPTVKGVTLQESTEDADDPVEKIVDECDPKLYQDYQEAFQRLGFGFIPPKHSHVSVKLNQFTKELLQSLEEANSDIGKIIGISVWAHTRLIDIHGYQDGNGRLARLFMNAILIENGLPHVNFKEFDNYKVMSEQARKGDMSAFKKAITEYLINKAESNLNTFKAAHEVKESDLGFLFKHACVKDNPEIMIGILFLSRLRGMTLELDNILSPELNERVITQLTDFCCFSDNQMKIN